MVSLVQFTRDIPAAVPSGPLDYQSIAAGLASDSIGLLRAWLPAGQKRGRNYVVGNIDGDKGESLSIDLATGKWIDFASGDAGSDLISLYGRMHGMSNHEAALKLAGPTPPVKERNLSSIRPVKPDRVELSRVWNPAPAWQEKPACRHPKFGTPSMAWHYRDESGRVIGIVARYDPAGERKQFLPWTWNGAAWEPKGWSELRPLYGLDGLLRSSGSVLLVEGEKACEAARKMVGPDWYVTTWPGGAQAVSRADWNPLKGRSVLMWPDADEAGVKAMAAIREAIEATADHVSVMDVSKFPAKWDAADALADGWDQARFESELARQFGQPATVTPLKVATAPEPTIDPLIKKASRDVPPHLLNIPGVLGDGVAWMLETAMRPQPLYAVQTMLALGSVILGRNHKTTFNNWSALYFCIIGESATGKEAVKHSIETILEEAGLHQLGGFSSYSSGSGLISSLIQQPNHVHVSDEFGKYLESLKDKGNGLKREVAKLMVELWGRVDGIQRSAGMSTNGMNNAQIAAQAARLVIKPSLVQVAMTTAGQFYDALTTASVQDGFLNRWLAVQCHAQPTPSQFNAKKPVPQALLEWCVQLRQPVSLGNTAATVLTVNDAAPTPHMMDFDEDALRMIRAFDAECCRKAVEMSAYNLAEMWGRANEISMRLSMIIARSCGSATIRREHLKWCQEYVEFHTEEFIKQVRTHVSDSSFAGAMQDVSSLLQRKGSAGLTTKRIRDYSAKFRMLPPRGQADVLEMLRQDGSIEGVQRKHLSGQKGSVHWRWIESEDEGEG